MISRRSAIDPCTNFAADQRKTMHTEPSLPRRDVVLWPWFIEGIGYEALLARNNGSTTPNKHILLMTRTSSSFGFFPT